MNLSGIDQSGWRACRASVTSSVTVPLAPLTTRCRLYREHQYRAPFPNQDLKRRSTCTM